MSDEGNAILDTERCPACKRKMQKGIEPDGEGGFYYIFKCSRHGLMERRHPTIKEIEEFNQ